MQDNASVKISKFKRITNFRIKANLKQEAFAKVIIQREINWLGFDLSLIVLKKEINVIIGCKNMTKTLDSPGWKSSFKKSYNE